MSLPARSKLHVRSSPGKGRGVFCSQPISRGETIEQCPVIFFDDGADAAAVEETPLRDYYYRWRDNENAFVLGFGCLYNHSYQPNASYCRDFENKTMNFIALRDLETGEEVTVNYNGRPDSRDAVWFDCRIEDER